MRGSCGEYDVHDECGVRSKCVRDECELSIREVMVAECMWLKDEGLFCV